MLREARVEARALDHGWVGVEHLLLALARSESVAGRALTRAGADYDRARAWLIALPVDPEAAAPPPYSEESRETRRLSRIAASVDAPSPEAWLLQLLRDPDSIAAHALRALAGGRGEVAAALRELGVDVPGEPPPDVERNFGERVFVPRDRLEDVLRALPTGLPDGATFGFNTTRDNRAWVVADRRIDLPALVEEVIAGG